MPVDVPDNYGRTALMHAFIKGNQQIINTLLQNGANINATDRNNESILIWYLDAGQIQIVKILMQMGSNPDIGLKDGKTALILAAEKQYNDLVELFLEKKANPVYLDSSGNTFYKYYTGNSPLVFSYHNFMKIYNSKYYSSKSNDISRFIDFYAKNNDEVSLKKFFLNTSESDCETRKTIINLTHPTNNLLNDSEVISVLEKDLVKHYLIHDKIALLKQHPQLFMNVINATFIQRLFEDIERDDFRANYIDNFILALRKRGFVIEKVSQKCSLCQGKGEFSNYSSWNENDNYSYLCSCFNGNQIQIKVSQNGKLVINYKSEHYNS